MAIFDSFLDTASKAFNWLDDNKAALDLLSGAAKGFGAYMSYKQQKEGLDFQRKQYEDAQRRWGDTTAAPTPYDNSVPLSSFQASGLLAGNMADALKR